MSVKKNKFSFICALILILMPITFLACKQDEIVASTDKFDVRLSEVNDNIKLAKFEYNSIFDDDSWKSVVVSSDGSTEQFKKSVIDYLIMSHYKDEENKKNGYSYSEKELNDMLDSAKQNIEDDKIKSNEYKSLNIDDHVLKKYIKDKMIENKHQEEFNKKVKIKEEDIKKYYKDKINEFKEKEFDCYQIWIKNPNDKNKAENAYEDLKKGMDFSTVAKKYSEDENSKNKGGYIGKIKKENLIPELREKALIMRDKEYTGVVKSKNGYFIIKIDNQRNLTKTLDSCRTKIKDDLLEELYQENNKKIINRIGVKYYKDNIKKINIQL